MRHSNAGFVSLVGASSLVFGFTLGIMASNTAIENGIASGTDGMVTDTGTHVIGGVGDGDGDGVSVNRIDRISGDGRSTVQEIHGDGYEIVYDGESENDDESGKTDSKSGKDGDETDSKGQSDGLKPVAKSQKLPSDGSAYGNGMVAKREPVSGNATQSEEQMDVTDKKTKSVKELLTKHIGDSVVLGELTIATWKGGDGYRLVVSAYGDSKAFSDGKSLSNAFGKLSRDLAKLAASGFDDIDIVDIAVLGIDGLGGKVPKKTPSSEDLAWAAGASVDIPSKDGKSVGDVNRASVMFGGKSASIDMTEYDFSSRPGEE